MTMPPAATPVLSRPTPVRHLAPGGQEVRVEATETERAALATELGLPGIARLDGRFRLLPTSGGGVRVEGRVSADVTQVCVLSLEPFDAAVDETVDVSFTEDGPPPPEEGVTEAETDLDAPDAIEGGRIDLGRLTAEFLALGLDPYPRKPGAAFEEADGAEEAGLNPFAALAALKRE